MGERRHMVQSLSVLDRFKEISDYEGMLAYPDGSPVAPVDAIAALVEARKAGFEVLPACDHHDERGMCLGHPDKESL